MADSDKAITQLPEHFAVEWPKIRDLIDKLDDRIHDTRKVVFGLFSSLLIAGNLVTHAIDKDKGGLLTPGLGFGLYLVLLGLLLAGRFIEQQAHLLQSAAASRALVLEILTPIELTDTLSDRFASGWAHRTITIYSVLGLVAGIVTVVAMPANANGPSVRLAWFLSPVGGGTGIWLWSGAVVYLGFLYFIRRISHQDIRFARDGEDWSFSRTGCTLGEAVDILLVNHHDREIYPDRVSATMVRVFDENGHEVDPATSATTGESRNELTLPTVMMETGRIFPQRRACRWTWFPPSAGTWALQVHGSFVFARRMIRVLPEKISYLRPPT
jgi:hypothetical protein